jgi:hypothetical protein
MNDVFHSNGYMAQALVLCVVNASEVPDVPDTNTVWVKVRPAEAIADSKETMTM